MFSFLVSVSSFPKLLIVVICTLSKPFNGFVYMIFARGSESKEVFYKTIYFCVPISVLASVEGIVNRYKSRLKRNDNNNLTLSISSLNGVIKISKKILGYRNLSRVSLARFIIELYRQSINRNVLK